MLKKRQPACKMEEKGEKNIDKKSICKYRADARAQEGEIRKKFLTKFKKMRDTTLTCVR